MMKFIIVVLLLSISFFSFAQSGFLKEAAAKLDKTLVAKDTLVLKQLLHRDISYGHSNGWVQQKENVLNDLSAGKMAYTTIVNTEAVWTVTNDVATMRANTEVVYSLNGQPGQLKLHVLQVWLKTNKGWQLLARQGVKM